MYLKRMLVAATFMGFATIPLSLMGSGMAAAEPTRACPQPAPVDPNQQAAPCEGSPASANNSGDFALSPGLSNQLNQAVGNLPSPVEVNAPVRFGFGLGLPGIALPDLNVPLVLGDLSAPDIPGIGIGVPKLPGIGIGVPKLPGIGIGIPKLPF